MKLFKDCRPIMGQDPFVFYFQGCSKLIQSKDERAIVVYNFQSYTGEGRVVWQDPREQQVWAPECHGINDKWYIYYAHSDGDNRNHRTYVLEGDSPYGPFDKYQVGPDVWGIDMTVFHHGDSLYAVWSGWEGSTDEFPQNLYIGKMESPTELRDRVKISFPQYSWEMSHAAINEGPQVLQRGDSLSLLFSANASWTPDYCTGILKLVGDDPLNPDHWWKSPEPMAYNVGHAQVLDNNLIYHRKMSPFPGWTDREIKVVPLERFMEE